MDIRVIKERILSLTDDINFTYQGNIAGIFPISRNKILMGYKDIDKEYTDIEDLMNDKIFNGKSLTEISDSIIFD